MLAHNQDGNIRFGQSKGHTVRRKLFSSRAYTSSLMEEWLRQTTLIKFKITHHSSIAIDNYMVQKRKVFSIYL